MKIYDITKNKKMLKELNSNTNNKVNDTKVFIIVLADWCGHCQNLKPEVEEFITHMNNNHSDYSEKNSIAVIKDTDIANLDILKDDQIMGFPHLALYGGSGKIKDYSGGRTKDDLLKFINKEFKNTGQLGGKRKKSTRKRPRKRNKNGGRKKTINLHKRKSNNKSKKRYKH